MNKISLYLYGVSKFSLVALIFFFARSGKVKTKLPKIQETPHTVSVLFCMYSPVRMNTPLFCLLLYSLSPCLLFSLWFSFQMRRTLDSCANLPVTPFKPGAGCPPHCNRDLEQEDDIRLAGMGHLLCAGSWRCRWAPGFMVSERSCRALADNKELKPRPDHKDSF